MVWQTSSVTTFDIFITNETIIILMPFDLASMAQTPSVIKYEM